MKLSNDLLTQFVKITKTEEKPKGDTTLYGTAEVDENGNVSIRFDGADISTPATTTVSIQDGDYVTAMIKNHAVIITGNKSAPAAVKERPSSSGGKVSFVGTLIGETASLELLQTERARIDKLYADDVTIRGRLDTNEGKIENLEAADVNITGRLTSAEGNITDLQTKMLTADSAVITDLQAKMLTADSATIKNLEAADVDITGRLSTAEGNITNLQAEKLDAESAKLIYANIDFSNIGKAAMEYFYSQSGLIEDVTIGDGTITGHLVGVTISGDLIEGNTVVAEKLVIKGEDGLYYKLNTDGVVTEAEQTAYNSLNGQVILAKSITASKISVDDLVAFDATIAGINITDGALYSGTKSSVDNTTSGFYLDKDGQIAFGGADNFVKFYKDTDGTYKLAISADSIVFATTGKDVETAITEVNDEANAVRDIAESADEKATNAQTLIAQLSDSISMLVTDGNGTSLMTQTDEGWVFSTADIQSAINSTVEQLNSLNVELGDTSHTVDVLQQAVDDLGEIAEYVTIGTYEDEPCIELGEGDSEFKLRITNTRMMFMEGSSVVAYFNNQSLYIKKAVVEEELQQGGFVWKARSNGNLGLVWKGGV